MKNRWMKNHSIAFLLLGSLPGVSALADSITTVTHEAETSNGWTQSVSFPATGALYSDPAGDLTFLEARSANHTAASPDDFLFAQSPATNGFASPDDVALTHFCQSSAPEPLTYGFVAVGLIALGIGTRRRRRR